MPNTHFMQEMTRGAYDYYLENVEGGQAPAEPHYLCIPKGDNFPLPLSKYAKLTFLSNEAPIFQSH